MNPLNKTFFCYDYKHGGRIRKWGKVIDFINDEAIVYISSNPTGAKIFNVKQSDIQVWLDSKTIFLQEVT